MSVDAATGGWTAPGDARVAELLRGVRSVAVVGVSPSRHRPSYGVTSYLLRSTGWDVYLVNPVVAAAGETVLGQRVWPDLASLPVVPDLVDVFRRAEHTPEVARAAVAVGASALWLQLGVSNAESARIAQEAGLAVVMDRCLKVEHARLDIPRRMKLEEMQAMEGSGGDGDLDAVRDDPIELIE